MRLSADKRGTPRRWPVRGRGRESVAAEVGRTSATASSRSGGKRTTASRSPRWWTTDGRIEREQFGNDAPRRGPRPDVVGAEGYNAPRRPGTSTYARAVASGLGSDSWTKDSSSRTRNRWALAHGTEVEQGCQTPSPVLRCRAESVEPSCPVGRAAAAGRSCSSSLAALPRPGGSAYLTVTNVCPHVVGLVEPAPRAVRAAVRSVPFAASRRTMAGVTPCALAPRRPLPGIAPPFTPPRSRMGLPTSATPRWSEGKRRVNGGSLGLYRRAGPIFARASRARKRAQGRPDPDTPTSLSRRRAAR